MLWFGFAAAAGWTSVKVWKVCPAGPRARAGLPVALHTSWYILLQWGMSNIDMRVMVCPPTYPHHWRPPHVIPVPRVFCCKRNVYTQRCMDKHIQSLILAIQTNDVGKERNMTCMHTFMETHMHSNMRCSSLPYLVYKLCIHYVLCK